MLAALRTPVPRTPWVVASRFIAIADLANSLPPDPSQPPRATNGFPPPRPSARQPVYEQPQFTRLRLHCHSSPNNTITTLTKEDGSTIAWFSGGSCGFKKGNRSSYEAGYQCAARIFKKVEEIAPRDGRVKVEVFLKGFGQGREALKAALLATEGEQIRPLVESITDRTPIKIGGTRAKKARRI